MKLKVILPVIVAVVLAGAGAGYYFMNQKDDSSKPKEQASSSTTSSSQTQGDSQQQTSDVASKLPAQTIGQAVDCSLYTFENLKPIWDVTFVDTDEGKVGDLNGNGAKLYSCDYNETDSGMGLSVVFEFREFESEDAAKQDMANVRNGAKFGDEVYFVQDELTDVGDEAFFSTPKKQVDNPKNPNKQMYVRKGNLVMLISAVNLDGIKADYGDKIVESYKLHF